MPFPINWRVGYIFESSFFTDRKALTVLFEYKFCTITEACLNVKKMLFICRGSKIFLELTSYLERHFDKKKIPISLIAVPRLTFAYFNK